ncbi:MAG: fluoride efflux transporter FluC, partial [Bdellovibrionia bacterium]
APASTTFLVNGLGSFFIGILWSYGIQSQCLSHPLFLGLTVGFLGGFTTFSSYCLDVIRLLQNNDLKTMAAYLILSPSVGCLTTYFGMKLGQLCF